MLFTKSINSETLETLTEFQKRFCSDSYSISPMNAIGVMGKVDELWKIIEPKNTPLIRGKRVIDSLYSSHPYLSQIFQSIFPVSALIGLGCRTLDENDLQSIKSLSHLTDKQFIATFADIKFFVKETDNVHLCEKNRKKLLNKLGLYGVYEAVIFLKEHPDASVERVSRHLENTCGISKIISAIITHFGKRSTILKARNSLTSIIYSINVEKSKTPDPTLVELFNNFTNQLSTILFSIRDYELWETLSKIYEGRICINDSEAICDLKNVAGENGGSASNKLGLCYPQPIDDLIKLAKCKRKKWAAKYTFAKLRNKRDLSYIYRVLSEAFSDLESEIISAQDEIKKAELVLKYNNEYLFDI